MAERFIVHFDGEQAAWLNAADELVRGPVDDAALAADGRECTLLIPGEDVLLTRVTLPPIRQAKRRLQAAAFALEDRLVTRVDDLHFALAAKADADGDTPVLVVDRALMKHLLDACETAGLDIVQAVPDVLALAAAESDSWHVAVVDDRVLTRTGHGHGFACEQALWPVLASGCTPPARIVLERARTNSAAQSLAPERALDPSPDIESVDYADDEILLAHLLAHADTREAINLRQGALARASAMQAWWQPFRLTAGLAAAWLLIALAARGIESYQLHQRIDTLEARSESVFRETFPRVGTINDLRVQAEQNIRALRGSGGSGGVFPLLQATAEVAGQAGSLTIQSLQYRDGALYLSLRGDSVQSLEALRAGFARQRGTTLNVESADAAANGVQIRASVTAEPT
ncbi:ral secretion pathway protein L putative [Salinisphaera shabanensis E1L3A]|uniref:Type II secretion system protein L n=1 Tax=Salinisphaera shabanensis E1L3A TaxID=1033802 RepID=U2FP23_9GAMM|nr:type II secretion system protein GspL [Salinisphaera shabanensis]ERJ17924.1 ral secretion pathway protein L putative [Salinisphaera shabanensis E1L3A]